MTLKRPKTRSFIFSLAGQVFDAECDSKHGILSVPGFGGFKIGQNSIVPYVSGRVGTSSEDPHVRMNSRKREPVIAVTELDPSPRDLYDGDPLKGYMGEPLAETDSDKVGSMAVSDAEAEAVSNPLSELVGRRLMMLLAISILSALGTWLGPNIIIAIRGAGG